MKTLQNWLPMDDLIEFPELQQFIDYELVSEHENNHSFSHKNITHWCVIKSKSGTLYTVGFNENVSRGWSFPVKKL